MEGKELYKVKRGDAFLSIASRHETTIDCIMHLNGLQRLDQLYPGDELVMLRLNLNVKIDVPRERLSLMKEGRLLKAYPLLEARVKSGASGTLRTTIRGKAGFVDGPRSEDHFGRLAPFGQGRHPGEPGSADS